MTESQYDKAMYELDDALLAGELSYEEYIHAVRDLNEEWKQNASSF